MCGLAPLSCGWCDGGRNASFPWRAFGCLRDEDVSAGARTSSPPSSALVPSVTRKGQARGQVLTVAGPTARWHSEVPSCVYYAFFWLLSVLSTNAFPLVAGI